MKTLYSAVGRFERRNGESGLHPVILVKGQEHMVGISEMMIWTCLNWRILDLAKLKEHYSRLAHGSGLQDCSDFERCVKRLLQRGLIVSGMGDNDADALYDLMNSLYIIPVISGILVKTIAFFKFLLIQKVPFSKAKAVFRTESLTGEEKQIVKLTRQAQLSTAELIKCIEYGIYDLSNDGKIMAALYDDDDTTCDNIGSYVRGFSKQRSVIETVANLYLRKLIIFERI